MNNEYSFGYCKICGKLLALKDRYCQNCQDTSDLPEFWKDFFGKEHKNED